MSAKKLTRLGARNLTVALDRIATVVQANPEILGIDPKIAMDFAKRVDWISDSIEKTAAANYPKNAAASNGGVDPEIIGEKKTGPLEMVDSQAPWMNGEFTQQEFSELSGKQEAGSLPEKGGQKVASSEARISRIERILIRMATEGDEKKEEAEEKKEEEAKKKAGDEKKEEAEEKKEEEAKKKASAQTAGFNLFE